MARFALVAAVVGFSGCFVPVEVDPPDGSVPLPDSGWLVPCETSSSIDLAPGMPFSVFPACANATVTVIGPDGGVVGSEGTPITPTEPGVYMVATEHDGQTRQTFVHVDGVPTTGFTQSYVDRVDGFGQLFFTARHSLLASEWSRITVYGADGGWLEQLDTSTSSLANGHGIGVVGDTVWMLRNNAVERYTDTGAGLHRDGSFAHPVASAALITDVSETRVVVVGREGIHEFLWNGNSVELGASFSNMPFNAGVFIEGQEVIDYTFCGMKPGCQTQVCDPVRFCEGPARRVMGIEQSESLWVIDATMSFPSWVGSALPDGVTLQLLGRSTAAPVAKSPARAIPVLNRYQDFVWGTMAAYVSYDRQFVVPMPQNGSFYFARLENVRAVTARYVIVQQDPFTLRFIPR